MGGMEFQVTLLLICIYLLLKGNNINVGVLDPDYVLGPPPAPPDAPPPPRLPARVLVFKPAAQSETTSPVVDPQGVTYAADRFRAGARAGLRT